MPSPSKRRQTLLISSNRANRAAELIAQFVLEASRLPDISGDQKADYVASKLNAFFNIPFLPEEQEQVIFRIAVEVFLHTRDAVAGQGAFNAVIGHTLAAEIAHALYVQFDKMDDAQADPQRALIVKTLNGLIDFPVLDEFIEGVLLDFAARLIFGLLKKGTEAWEAEARRNAAKAAGTQIDPEHDLRVVPAKRKLLNPRAQNLKTRSSK